MPACVRTDHRQRAKTYSCKLGSSLAALANQHAVRLVWLLGGLHPPSADGGGQRRAFGAAADCRSHGSGYDTRGAGSRARRASWQLSDLVRLSVRLCSHHVVFDQENREKAPKGDARESAGGLRTKRGGCLARHGGGMTRCPRQVAHTRGIMRGGSNSRTMLLLLGASTFLTLRSTVACILGHWCINYHRWTKGVAAAWVACTSPRCGLYLDLILSPCVSEKSV